MPLHCYEWRFWYIGHNLLSLPVERTFNYDIISSSDLNCKLFKFGRLVAENTSEWLLLWICVNRLSAITCTERLRIFKTVSDVRTNIAAIVGCLLLSCALEAHAFWSFALRERPILTDLRQPQDVSAFPNPNVSNGSATLLPTRPSCSSFKAAQSGKIESLLVGWFTPMLPICLLLVCTLLLACRLTSIAFKHRAISHSGAHVASGIELQANSKGIPKGIRMAYIITFFTTGDILIDGIELVLLAWAYNHLFYIYISRTTIPFKQNHP